MGLYGFVWVCMGLYGLVCVAEGDMYVLPYEKIVTLFDENL
jgi:hypothetical protein